MTRQQAILIVRDQMLVCSSIQCDWTQESRIKKGDQLKVKAIHYSDKEIDEEEKMDISFEFYGMPYQYSYIDFDPLTS